MTHMVDKNYPFANREEYLEVIRCFPCSVYLLRKSSDFPIIVANDAFYHLINLDANRVHYQYGGKLSAIFDTNPYQHFNLENNTKASFQHNVCTPDGEKHIFFTQFVSLPDQKEFLLCTSMDITNYIDTQKSLEALEKRMQFLCNQTQVDLFEWDLLTDSITIYGATSILSGLNNNISRCELENHLSKLWDNRVCQISASEILSRIKDGELTLSCEMNQQNELGQSQWTQVCLTRQQNFNQPTPTVIGLLKDITEEKELSLNYLNETQFYHMLLSEKEAFGQVDITEDRILTVGGIWNLYNEFIAKLPYSHIIKEYINKVVHPEDRTYYLELMQCDNFVHSFDNGIQRLGCEFRRIVEQNKMVWMELCVHLFRQPTNGHLMALLYLSNIDAKKKQSLMLHYKSERDQLTSIYNKEIADTLIRQYLLQSEPESVHAFLILDLDDFKQINDIYGHQTGDDVLIRFAAILRKIFHRDDIIGRFGGDEFIILMKNVPSEQFISEKLTKLYSRLKEEKNPPLTCSIGVTLASGGSDYDEIFEQADKSLYKVKCEGKAQFCFYRPELSSHNTKVKSENISCQQPQPLKQISQHMPHTDTIQNQFDAFIGKQGDMAYLIDPETFDLICGNKAFYDRIGLTEAECWGLKCYEIVHRRNTPCPFCSKANWSSDKFYLWRDMNQSLEQEFLVKDKLVNWLGQEALLILLIDISNNKSIVDSVDNMASESHLLLGGIQRMEECKNLKDAITSSLETIGHFFRADSVSFWQEERHSRHYECAYHWQKDGKEPHFTKMDNNAMSGWLWNQKWNTPLIIESPEMMLGYSYEMYQFMKAHHISNQRWLCLQEPSKKYGFIVVENCSMHLQNISFLESISVFVINEIKSRTASESVLYISCHDCLTDLLNRYSYEEYLQHFDSDNVSSIGVVIANIDNMKGINNTQGSQVGNYYIKRFANLLKEIFSPEQVYRLNGDEFLVVAENISHLDLINCLKRLNTELAQKEDYTVSIGHNWDNIEKDLSDLIAIATADMRISKKKHYDSGIIQNNMEHGNMLHTLMTEIKDGHFEIYLQPKIDMTTQQLIGAEALIRQHGADNRIVPPCEFIPILEANNLIRFIDLFVFEEVCSLLEKWQHINHKNFIISLNFSRLTLLEEDILFNIEQILSYYHISRNNIEIEITENFLATGKSTLYQVIQDLYQAGCYLSLDDFGIRYANLSMLADINFHTLKLDKSLIKSISSRNANQVILKHIIHLCQDLDINVIAEGVETEIQQNILTNLGCNLGQGYLFGKPMPVCEFERTYPELFNSLPEKGK